MSTPPRSDGTRLVARVGTQAQVAVAASGRRFLYQWNAPRSPALRALFVPAFLVTGLLLLVLALLVLAAFLILTAAAVTALALATGPPLVARRLATIRRRQRSG